MNELDTSSKNKICMNFFGHGTYAQISDFEKGKHSSLFCPNGSDEEKIVF